MKTSRAVLILGLLTLTLSGCGAGFCLFGFGGGCPAPPSPLPNNQGKVESKKESESGFNPRLSTEIIVSQYLEQKYSCKGELISEEKSLIHRGYPELKLNPKKNVPIHRGTFTNLTVQKNSGGSLHFVVSNDSHKNFRVFVEPHKYNGNIGRFFGPPLLQVQKGVNQIQYKYETCSKYVPNPENPKAPHECVRWVLEEEGDIELIIGVTEITENPEICRLYPKCFAGVAVSYGACNEEP